MVMTIDVMLSSYGSILYFYVAYAMFMRLNLKETHFRTYVSKSLKLNLCMSTIFTNKPEVAGTTTVTQ